MIREISAEMLLRYLYPEMKNRWKVVDKGVFYRNYSCDVLNIYADEGTVELARDNFLRLLPRELLSSEDELEVLGDKKNADFKSVYEKMQRRLKLLAEAFVPFDTFEFRTGLDMECTIEKILSQKVSVVLKEVFGYDISRADDKYVLRAALLLPYFPQGRGDPEFIRALLSTLLEAEVVVKMSDYSGRDSTVCSMPRMTFCVIIDGLDARQYARRCREIAPLSEFVAERLAPADVFCEICVKGGSDTKILDYNYVI